MSFLTPIFVGAPPVPTEDLAKLTGRYIRDLLSYICLFIEFIQFHRGERIFLTS